MRWLRRAAAALALAAPIASLALLAQPSPPAARANVACDALSGAVKGISGGVEAMTGAAVGFGNPAGDVCNDVTGAAGDLVGNPIKSALQGVGKGIFGQVTEWVSEGSAWLIGEVAKGIDETTTPKLTGSAFVSQYGRMAEIAALMGAAMLLIAVIEGIAQGSVGMLLRAALVNLPLAFIATSVAYVVVQLLLVATDGLCHALSAEGHNNGRDFFKAAITGLGDVGGTAGRELGSATTHNLAGEAAGEASGTVAAPLFVTFLLAIVGAFAAFLVWLELLMRDAAIYVTSLFLPFALAAAIRPRWSSALRRTCELLLTLIGSKFVIVSIIVLAAGLIAQPEGRVEAILCASALMVLAAFAPFVLLRLVPFAEGAMSAAYNRRSATGGMQSGIQLASDIQILRGMARSNWEGSGVTLWEAGGEGGASGAAALGGGGSSKAGGGAQGAGAETAAEAGASAGPAGAAAAAAAAVPSAAQGGTKAAAQQLEGFAEASGDSGTQAGSAASPPSSAGGGRPNASGAGKEPASPTPPSLSGDSAPPPSPGSTGSEESGKQGGAAEKPPRPAPDGTGVKPEQGEEQ